MTCSMDDFNIKIPEELIAQYPSERREDSRLLILDLPKNRIIDENFYNIGKYLKDTDCIVYNDARVLHARLFGKKEDTDAKIEILLTRKIDGYLWHALVRPYKRIKAGTVIKIDNNLKLNVLEKLGDGVCLVHFSNPIGFKDLEKIGEIPLPKYIKRKPIPMLDEKRYQTVFSRKYGAVASPTAGLHFTEEIVKRLQKRGIIFVPVTLYVDWGTFKPVREKDYRKHKIHSEFYEINEKSASVINKCIETGRRIICVGTTSVRALESSVNDKGKVVPVAGETRLYIYPGYRFRVVDALITNFHMPDSTLILLVAAFAGKKKIEEAYNHAIKNRYKFFSYGDAMFIIKHNS